MMRMGGMGREGGLRLLNDVDGWWCVLFVTCASGTYFLCFFLLFFGTDGRQPRFFMLL